eukprot:5773512-Heterocapsa_arctica.AAC.1
MDSLTRVVKARSWLRCRRSRRDAPPPLDGRWLSVGRGRGSPCQRRSQVPRLRQTKSELRLVETE